MKYLIITLLSLYIQISFSQTKDEVAILELLKNQEKAWNDGNLEGFMIGYWNSDSLLFIGKNGPKYGYNTTLQNYKKSYGDTAKMGKLESTIISLKKLSKNYYFVVGKWYLKRSMGDLSGYYTLLLQKIKDKWVVIADHSS